MRLGPFPLEQSTPSPDPAGMPERRRVLIADADRQVVGVLHDALQAAECSVESVASAADLWETLRRMPVQLLVLALDLPGTAGVDVFARLREIGTPPPVVLLAPRGADPRTGPLRDQVAACLFKPIDAAALVGVCRRVFSLSEQSRLRERRAEARRGVRLPVTVDASGSVQPATLVSLSHAGFCLELAGASVTGRVRVTGALPGSGRALDLEGQIEWSKPLARGVLAGGTIVGVESEEKTSAT
jgi:DNA-binding response OmpR family regulator